MRSHRDIFIATLMTLITTNERAGQRDDPLFLE